MKKFKKVWKFFCNSGYDTAVYQDYREELVQQNSRMVQTTSFIGSAMMLLLTVVSLFVSSVSKVLPLYLTTAVFFISIYVIARISAARSNAVVLLCNYAFLTAAFFFAIGLDIIQRNPTATTVCVLLVALPLLIVDKPYREFLYFLLVTLFFMYESLCIKQSPKASLDVLNGLSFLVVGSFLGYKHNQMMLRNIRGHRLLTKQRDMDPLTMLLNKGALEYRARAILEQDNATAGIIVIDMDDFKFVNDTYGHHSGDELLLKVGGVLRETFRSTDLISRFGGDEFVVFLPMMKDRGRMRRQAEEVLQKVQKIRLDADGEYRARICMGMALCPEDGSQYEELFRNADAAMYHVKRNGKNSFEFYDANCRKKILVVDDIEMNRMLLKKTLDTEYEVLEAADGKSACEVLLKNKDTAIVITDIQMPNMDGIELIKYIRSTRQIGDVAIIANTQYGDPKQEEQLFKLGIDDFVYKAASPGIIKMRVRNVLKSRAGY